MVVSFRWHCTAPPYLLTDCMAYVCNLSLGPRWQLCSSPRYRDTLMPLSHCCCWSGRTGNFHPGQNTHQLHRLWGGGGTYQAQHHTQSQAHIFSLYKIIKRHEGLTCKLRYSLLNQFIVDAHVCSDTTHC